LASHLARFVHDGLRGRLVLFEQGPELRLVAEHQIGPEAARPALELDQHLDVAAECRVRRVGRAEKEACTAVDLDQDDLRVQRPEWSRAIRGWRGLAGLAVEPRERVDDEDLATVESAPVQAVQLLWSRDHRRVRDAAHRTQHGIESAGGDERRDDEVPVPPEELVQVRALHPWKTERPEARFP